MNSSCSWQTFNFNPYYPLICSLRHFKIYLVMLYKFFVSGWDTHAVKREWGGKNCLKDNFTTSVFYPLSNQI